MEDIKPLNVKVSRGVINGQMYDIIDHDEFNKSDNMVYLIPIEADIAGVEGQSIVVKAGNQLCSIYGNTETSITTSGTYILAVPKSDAELSNLNITASKDFNSNNYITVYNCSNLSLLS